MPLKSRKLTSRQVLILTAMYIRWGVPWQAGNEGSYRG
jgi:hypothetical protein